MFLYFLPILIILGVKCKNMIYPKYLNENNFHNNQNPRNSLCVIEEKHIIFIYTEGFCQKIFFYSVIFILVKIFTGYCVKH